MPLDAICLSAVRSELSAKLPGMRVDKIQQPERDALILTLRGNGSTERLLINAGTGSTRLHLTGAAYENPAAPPMFCMLLRKHLTGARLTEITQPPMERQLTLKLEGTNAFGEPCFFQLVCELMGRYSNLILTDAEGRILDCLRRIGYDGASSRAVLPGLFYELPPKPDKLVLTESEPETWLPRVLSGVAGTLDRALSDAFLGFSPLICRELAYRSYGRTDMPVTEAANEDAGEALLETLLQLKTRLLSETFTPWLLSEGEHPRDFAFMPITQYENSLNGEPLPDFSALLDAFYLRRDQAENRRRRSAQLTKTVKTARDRTARKLENQKRELAATADRKQLRENGDIIKANLYRMERGSTSLRAYDFYNPEGGEREIPLDPAKTPAQNAARYYKEYQKAKNAVTYLTAQINSAEQELTYLNSVLEALELAETEKDLSEIRQELTATDYLRARTGGKKERPVEQKPYQFRTTDGKTVLVGRNNLQNDRLTFRTAMKWDIWFHTQKIHGAHVILSGDGETTERDIYEAAQLAAWYSQGRGSGRVPVDYTEVRYVKKPSGSRPGMVIYTDQKTILAEPDEKAAERMRIK